MAKGIELKHKGGPYGDECSDYEFETATLMTLKEFVETVASNKKEWGYIRTSYFGKTLADYSHGEITYHTDDLDRLVVPKGYASGGWTRMDYIIDLVQRR